MADTLRWGNPPAGVQNAPVYLALSNGTFGSGEVSVEVTDNRSGADHTRALLDGVYDVGHIGAPPLMAALGRTKEYALVGTGLLRYPPQSLVAAPGIGDFRALRDQAVAINRTGTCSQSMLLTLLARAGMSVSELQLTTLGDGPAMVEAARQSSIAAAMLWEPHTSMVVRELGWRILTEGRDVWSPSRYCTMLYARRSLAGGAIVRSLLRAYAESVRAAQVHADAAAEAVIERMPDVPAEDVRRAVIREAPHWSADTSLDRGLLERVVGELEVQAVLADGFVLDDAIVAA